MRQWLIDLLGLGEIVIAKDGEIVNLWSEVHDLRQKVTDKDKEISRLTNLMLVRAGFIVSETVTASETKLEPINRKPSWPQRQRELEQADARKYADSVEKRWKEKPGAVFGGAEGDGIISSGVSEHEG